MWLASECEANLPAMIGSRRRLLLRLPAAEVDPEAEAGAAAAEVGAAATEVGAVNTGWGLTRCVTLCKLGGGTPTVESGGVRCTKER